MFISSEKKLTCSRFFLQPANTTHRQYEALRAYFVEGLPAKDVAARFGYTPGSFRQLVHRFRQDPERSFFQLPHQEVQRDQRQDELHRRVIALRKQNLSIYDISRTLEHEGQPLSPVTVNQALKVTCDLQLTVMASSLYRLLGQRLGSGYESAKSRKIFRDFIDATASVVIDKKTIDVRFQKRAHNPFLLAAGFANTDLKVPWLGNKRLRFTFG